jgi:hypothetical protein
MNWTDKTVIKFLSATATALAVATMPKLGGSQAVPPIPPNQIGAQALPSVDGDPAKGLLLDHLIALQPDTVLHVDENHPQAKDETNPGTRDLPWKTIKHAAKTLRAGQAAHVHTGTYQEDNIVPDAAGEKNKPIWIMAAPGQQVVILGDSAKSATFMILNKNWWIVDGFEINASGQKGQAIRVEDAAHVMVKNVNVHHGVAGAAVALVRAKDAIVTDSRIHEYTPLPNSQDSHGVSVTSGAERVLVQRIDSWGNIGDSVQCAGGGDPDTVPGPSPRDVTIRDSRFGNTHPDSSRTPRPRDWENAVDIKSCRGVSILRNKMFGFRPAESTAPGGAAVVVHYNADSVRIQGNRFWNNGLAASIGSAQNCCVGSVAVHRNLIFDGSAEGNAAGGGIRIGPTDVKKQAEAWVTNNTLAFIPNYGVRIGDDGPVKNPFIMNNIFMNVGGLALSIQHFPPPHQPSVTSDRNLFFMARRPRNWPYDQTSIFDQNPMFIDNPRINDFYTKDDSPTRDVAIPTGEPFDGDGLDIGFLESPPGGPNQ